MNLALIIYVLSVFDSIVGVSVLALILLGCAIPLTIMYIHIEEPADPEPAKAWLRKMLGAVVIAGILVILIPSRTTGYAMLAAYGAEQLVTSDTAERLAPKTLKLLEQYMDEQLQKEE